FLDGSLFLELHDQGEVLGESTKLRGRERQGLPGGGLVGVNDGWEIRVVVIGQIWCIRHDTLYGGWCWIRSGWFFFGFFFLLGCLIVLVLSGCFFGRFGSYRRWLFFR